jgi:hypothetical protein
VIDLETVTVDQLETDPFYRGHEYRSPKSLRVLLD